MSIPLHIFSCYLVKKEICFRDFLQKDLKLRLKELKVYFFSLLREGRQQVSQVFFVASVTCKVNNGCSSSYLPLYGPHSSTHFSVTRLGDFWKFLAINSLSKVAQKDCWLLGNFEKDQLMSKLLWILFRQHLGHFFNSASGHTDPVATALTRNHEVQGLDTLGSNIAKPVLPLHNCCKIAAKFWCMISGAQWILDWAYLHHPNRT